MDDFLNELKSKNKEFSDEYIKMMKQYYARLMNNPAELQQVLNGNPGGIDPEGGITIIPDKYCCIKTQDQDGNKIFINLVTSDKIDPPQEQHILEMNNQHGVRIPMSLSERFEDRDKEGRPCQVMDAIFNPDVLKKTETEPMVLQFIMTCIAGRVQERFKQSLNLSKVVRLKQVVYWGKSVRAQRIRARRVKIDEVMNDNKDNKDRKVKGDNMKMASEVNKEVNEKGKTPNWNFVIIKMDKPNGKLFKEINKVAKENIVSNGTNGRVNFNIMTNNTSNEMFEYYNGYNANPMSGYGILLVVEMELLGKSSGINLNISDENLTLYCGKFYSLELNLPYKIDSSNVKAMFIAENRLLYVYMPFYKKDIDELRKIAENEKNKEKKPTINLAEDYLFDVIQ